MQNSKLVYYINYWEKEAELRLTCSIGCVDCFDILTGFVTMRNIYNPMSPMDIKESNAPKQVLKFDSPL